MPMDYHVIMDGLKAAAAKAGDIVRDGASRTRTVRHKGRIDLVTETDMAVELMLKKELADLLPGSDFLAEETANDTEPGELTWIIDPLDGTTKFRSQPAVRGQFHRPVAPGPGGARRDQPAAHGRVVHGRGGGGGLDERANPYPCPGKSVMERCPAGYGVPL